MPKRKEHTFVIKVSAPNDVTKNEVKKEIRERIGAEDFKYWGPDIKIRKLLSHVLEEPNNG